MVSVPRSNPSHRDLSSASDEVPIEDFSVPTQHGVSDDPVVVIPEDQGPITLDSLSEPVDIDRSEASYAVSRGQIRVSRPRKDFSLPHIFVNTSRGNSPHAPNISNHTQNFPPAPLPGSTSIAVGSVSVIPRPLRNPNFLSNGCRQFLLSIIASYPRMITQHQNLPPFIHFYGCKLHFDGRASGAADGLLTDPTDMPMLKPLEAAVNVARMLVSQPTSGGMNDFIWRVIDCEHRHINEQVGFTHWSFDSKRCLGITRELKFIQMENFSLGETIAALQSSMLYGTMRVGISGRDYAGVNSSIVTTMEVGDNPDPVHAMSWKYSWNRNLQCGAPRLLGVLSVRATHASHDRLGRSGLWRKHDEGM